MSTRRTARVASMIREVVSSAILTELRDPRIKNVTVLGAEVSPDLRHASVRVSVMGDEKTASLSMHGLNSARGYLQSRVGEYIKSRYTPELRFVLDDGVRKSVETAALIRQALENSSPSGQPSDDSDELPEDLAGIDVEEWEDVEDDEEGKTDA
jgi:ribosome-binding factor A